MLILIAYTVIAYFTHAFITGILNFIKSNEDEVVRFGQILNTFNKLMTTCFDLLSTNDCGALSNGMRQWYASYNHHH